MRKNQKDIVELKIRTRIKNCLIGWSVVWRRQMKVLVNLRINTFNQTENRQNRAKKTPNE